MIWLDMDGVLADFDGHYQACFGVKPTRWPEPDTVDWKLIAAVPDFYLNLPLMPGAKELHRFVLYTSGYAPEVARPELQDNCGFLTKPFTPTQLLATVRQCLDQAANGTDKTRN